MPCPPGMAGQATQIQLFMRVPHVRCNQHRAGCSQCAAADGAVDDVQDVDNNEYGGELLAVE